MLIAYLDEFGHIGPYIARADEKHNDSPVFGLAGFVLPDTEVRNFATWFYQRKCELLAFEIERANQPAYLWEKKGSSLYTAPNVTQYPELRKFTNRFLNQLKSRGGFLFYVGIEKRRQVEQHDSTTLYMRVLREAIKRLNQECEEQDTHFLLMMDEHAQRDNILSEASRQMFTRDAQWSADRLIEPPFQLESHRYQTVQAADWICGLIGRLGQYECASEDYPEMAWVQTYFQGRIRRAARRSSLRRL